MTMKIHLTILCLLLSFSASARQVVSNKDSLREARAQHIMDERNVSHLPTWSFHVGTDVGGSVPEFKYIPKVFTANPQLNISVGTRIEVPLTKHLSVTTGVEYKKIAMKAGAYVENMHAYVPQADGGAPLSQYFTGSAVMEEDFSMWEYPLYFTWILGEHGHNRLMLGAFGAHIFQSGFNTVPTRGYIGDKPDYVNDGYNIQERDETVAMNFHPVLSKWDAGLTFGYEYEVFQRIRLGMRAAFGFKDIFKKDCFPDSPELAKCLEFRLTQMRVGIYLSYDIYSSKGWWANRKKE